MYLKSYSLRKAVTPLAEMRDEVEKQEKTNEKTNWIKINNKKGIREENSWVKKLLFSRALNKIVLDF